MFVTKFGPLYDLKTWEVLLGVLHLNLEISFFQRFKRAYIHTVTVRITDVETLTPSDSFAHQIKQLNQLATVSSSSRTLDKEWFYAIRDATVILSGVIHNTDASCFQTYLFRCAIMQSHLDFELQLQNILAIAINQSDGTDWLCNLLPRIDCAVGVVTILRIDSLFYVPDLPKNMEATCELTTGIMQFGLPAGEYHNLVLCAARKVIGQWFNIPYSTLYLNHSLFLQTLKSTFGPHLSVALMLPLVWDTFRDPFRNASSGPWITFKVLVYLGYGCCRVYYLQVLSQGLGEVSLQNKTMESVRDAV
ncbi:hypothetical protein C8J56DRAFT_888236 [Mycena floridula]|nr:hypothetical protein C8J56DRAFT_888236 [Mycena floridula]